MLSVALATYNEERNLARCLASVQDTAGEIIVVDGGSGDKTCDIAASFGATVVHTGNPPIFHINKQKALDRCRGRWILQLDADEEVSGELMNEIEATIKAHPEQNGFFLPRKNYFLGHWLRKGGQYPDYVIRLVRNGKAHFPAKSVHEQIAVDGDVGHLTHALHHYTYDSIGEYRKKARTYVALEASELHARHLVPSVTTALSYYLVKPSATFFLLFFRHKGFVDGWYGFLFALFSAMHFPLAYRLYVKKFRR